MYLTEDAGQIMLSAWMFAYFKEHQGEIIHKGESLISYTNYSMADKITCKYN